MGRTVPCCRRSPNCFRVGATLVETALDLLEVQFILEKREKVHERGNRPRRVLGVRVHNVAQ